MPTTPRPHAPRPALWLIALAAIAAPPAPAQQDDALPDWVSKAMAKEARRLKTRPVNIADGQYRFELAGKPGQPEAFDGGWYIASDIRAEVPLECYLFTGNNDLASLIVSIADANIEANATANNGKIAARSVHSIDAGSIDGAPFLSLEWLYTIGEAPNALLGFTKVRAALNDNVSLACSHNYLGYRETFENAFAGFVASAEIPASDMPPYYEEVAVQSIGDRRVGITRLAFANDAEGYSLIKMISASLLPVGPSSVASSDSATTSWSTVDGRVINVYSASAENGELVSNLELGRDDDGNWISSGVFQGKQIDAVLDGSVEPLSDLGQVLAVRNFLDGDETEAHFPVWLADADPTKFLDGKISRDSADVTDAGKLTLGPLTFDATFAPDGQLDSAALRMGPLDMSIDRVWSNGAIP